MKKGFTLVELLATILILGIITTIAMYNIKKQTEFAKEEAIKESTKEIIKAADNYYADLGYVNFPANGISIKNLDLKSTGFKSGKVKLINNEYVVVDLTDGKYCINGTKDNLELVKGRCARPNYVYYVSETAYDEETEEYESISIEDCSNETPNEIAYLKFSVENNELGDPMVCTTYFGDEVCYGEDFLDYINDVLDLFNYDESWPSGEISEIQESPDGKAVCYQTAEYKMCANEDVIISISIATPSGLSIINNKTNFACSVGILREEYIGICGISE